MSCKLVIRRFTEGKDIVGDVVNAYPTEIYLGDMVEPQGGAFVVIDVTNCEFNSEQVSELLDIVEEPTTHNKIYGLDHNLLGNNHYNELISNGRISMTVEELMTYKVSRTGYIPSMSGENQWLTE